MFKTILINGFLICLVFTQVFANSKTVKLSSGYDMPLVGLGTWNMKPDEVDDAVTNALNNGYQHIDTAFVYSNEEAIGNTLKKWFDNGGKREDLFITTKLPPFGNRASDVEKAFNISMEKLGLDYVDMYLNHGPFAIKSLPNIQPIVHQNGTFEFDKNNDIVAVWKEMEKLVKSGRARSIGLSNFNISQISRVLDAAEIKPSNLQVELQIYNQQKELREFCKKHDIAVTGYSTLGSAGAPNFAKSPNLKNLPRQLENPVVKKIAEKHNKTPAQILLKHAVQNNVIVIPKSTHLNRIKENIDLFDFELTEDDLKEIDNLDLGEKGRMFDFLFFKGIDKHPEFPFADQLHKS